MMGYLDATNTAQPVITCRARCAHDPDLVRLGAQSDGVHVSIGVRTHTEPTPLECVTSTEAENQTQKSLSVEYYPQGYCMYRTPPVQNRTTCLVIHESCAPRHLKVTYCPPRSRDTLFLLPAI
ncbi:hypothetical protein KL906_001695 [Ogataea polymorpha]|nr:hypothetical protein KL906_001695 [Ogataea polymorpha]